MHHDLFIYYLHNSSYTLFSVLFHVTMDTVLHFCLKLRPSILKQIMEHFQIAPKCQQEGGDCIPVDDMTDIDFCFQ